jgi:hypothetical protein
MSSRFRCDVGNHVCARRCAVRTPQFAADLRIGAVERFAALEISDAVDVGDPTWLDTLIAGMLSTIMYVPASVPSLRHNSDPWMRSNP